MQTPEIPHLPILWSVCLIFVLYSVLGFSKKKKWGGERENKGAMGEKELSQLYVLIIRS